MAHAPETCAKNVCKFLASNSDASPRKFLYKLVRNGAAVCSVQKPMQEQFCTEKHASMPHAQADLYKFLERVSGV